MTGDKVTLEDYINATVDAGKRVRKIVTLFSMACILSFMAYWNSYHGSWTDARLNMYQRAINCLDDKQPCMLSNEERDLFHLATQQNLQYTKMYLQDNKDIAAFLNRESYMIRVPILGIAFDINDLGMFTGLTLAFLLIMFWFSWEREEENLTMAFKLAKEKNVVEEVYHYLSMGQVLTLPQREVRTGIGVWKYVPKLIFTGPFLVYTLIFVNDLRSFKDGQILSPDRATLSMLASTIFWVVIAMLTMVCIRRSVRVDNVWKNTYKVYINPPPPAG